MCNRRLSMALTEKVQVPSVGRDVHYFAYGTPGGEFAPGEPRAAKITEVYRDPDGQLNMSEVGLVVFNPTGQLFNRFTKKADYYGQPGHWDWPPYVPPIERPA